MDFPKYTASFIRAIADYGYRAITTSPVGREIVRPVPPTRFDEDQSEEVDVIDDPEYLLACREYDKNLILAARKSLVARADANSIAIAGLNIQWPRRMARLKTWGGQQTLGDLLRQRLDSLLPWAGKAPKKKAARKPKSAEAPEAQANADDEPEESPVVSDTWTWKKIPAISFEAALPGVSGVIPGHARINGIDMGFSPDGQKITLHPWLEVLVMIGMEFAPITVIPSEQFSDGYFAVYSGGLWYPFFRRVRIDPYYYAWDLADVEGLLPHQFAKLIDPEFSPGHFDDLQIPKHLLRNPDMLWNEIERLTRIMNRSEGVALS